MNYQYAFWIVTCLWLINWARAVKWKTQVKKDNQFMREGNDYTRKISGFLSPVDNTIFLNNAFENPINLTETLRHESYRDCMVAVYIHLRRPQ